MYSLGCGAGSDVLNYFLFRNQIAAMTEDLSSVEKELSYLLGGVESKLK